MVSQIRRFKNMVKLSDWEDRILRREQEIDAFCSILASRTAALLPPICFLVMKSYRLWTGMHRSE